MILKTKYYSFLLLLICIILMCSCQVFEKKADNINSNLSIYHVGNSKSNEQYNKELASFRVEADLRFDANDSVMVHFKADLEFAKKSGNSFYVKQIRDLEKRNADLKTRLQNYVPNNEAAWQKFKLDFSAEMVALEKSFAALGVRTPVST